MSSCETPFYIKNAELGEIKESIDFARKQAYIAYIGDTDEEELNDYLDKEYDVNKFTNYIKDKENIFLVVRNKEEKIIAYSIVTKCEMEIEEVNKGKDYELKKLYVDEASQGTGLGTKLIQENINKIISKIREDLRSYESEGNFIEPKIFVNVYIKNSKAQRFYEKNKFKFVTINGIPFGDGVDYDNVYVNDFNLLY